jgi:hypothetical protein
MKKFSSFILVFITISFVTDFLLANLFDRLYQKTFTGQTGGEINKYLALPELPSLLVMGNSRARYQIDPDSLAVPSYSLCHAGMGQVFQTGLLEILERKNKLPKAILLHVDFEEYIEKDNLEDIGTLRYYYNRTPSITSEIDSISQYESIKYLFRFYRYNGRVISTLKNYIQSSNHVNVSNGYQYLAPVPNDSANFIASPIDHPINFHYQNLRHLRKFLAICKRNNIELLCFSSPYYVPQSYTSIVSQPIDSMFHVNNIPYLNTASKPLPTLLNHATFWQNTDHLNALGARYLSQQISHWSKPYLTK